MRHVPRRDTQLHLCPPPPLFALYRLKNISYTPTFTQCPWACSACLEHCSKQCLGQMQRCDITSQQLLASMPASATWHRLTQANVEATSHACACDIAQISVLPAAAVAMECWSHLSPAWTVLRVLCLCALCPAVLLSGACSPFEGGKHSAGCKLRLQRRSHHLEPYKGTPHSQV